MTRGRASPIKFDQRSAWFDPMDTGDTSRVAPLPFAFYLTPPGGCPPLGTITVDVPPPPSAGFDFLAFPTGSLGLAAAPLAAVECPPGGAVCV